MKAVLAILAIVAITTGASAQTFHSGGSCIATASSDVWKSAQDACVSSFAVAYKNICSATSTDDLISKCYDQMYGVASAIVQVRVKALAACISFGNTYACAQANAAASSEISAIINVVSQAIAVAINNCPNCDPASASATAQIFSQLVVQIEAEVAAKVKAKVCVGPNQAALAKAYAACCAEAYAHGFTWAFAKAVVSGGCTAMSADIAAKAIVEVQNFVNVDQWCNCEGYSTICSSTAGCSYKKAGPDPSIYFKAFAPWPLTYAKVQATCATSATQLV